MRGVACACGVFCFSFSSVALAVLEEMTDNHYDTFAGINYKQSVIRPESGWDRLFVKTQPGFDVYLGWRFHPRFSSELGYEWSANKPVSTDIAAGESLLGVANTSGFADRLTGKVRFKTGHFDLNYFIPWVLKNWMPEWIVSLGVGATKPNIKISAASEPALAPVNNPFTSQFTKIEGRSRAIFRGGVGIQTTLVEDLGMRALLRYEHTSVLRGRGTNTVQNKQTEQIFGNGFSLALGLYLKF